MDELRRSLHEAAEAHQPDSARMRARMERGMAPAAVPERRPAGSWLRVAGAAAAVAGVVAVAGLSVASALRDDEPARPPAAESSASQSPLPTATGEPSPQTSTTDGLLWSDGSVNPNSIDNWSQSDITLDNEEPLSALTVELRIALTPGVTSAGAWRTLPEADFSLDVTEADGFMVYRWTLKDGRTVPAGRHVFAGQYDHTSGGRDAKDDSYTAQASSDGEEFGVQGDFAPRR